MSLLLLARLHAGATRAALLHHPEPEHTEPKDSHEPATFNRIRQQDSALGNVP